MAETFGSVLRDHRRLSGLSLRALASVSNYSRSHIAEVEAGRRRVNVELAARLDIAVGAGGRLSALATGADPQTLRVTSHKFAPAYVGPAAIPALAHALGAHRAVGQWWDAWRADVDHPDGPCEVWLYPHGVAVHHLTEDRQWADLTALAGWRYATYPELMAWAGSHLAAANVEARPDYVLSAYVITEAPWCGARLDTAVRLLSMPRNLLGGDGTQSERKLLADGFAHPELAAFGVEGASIGYASWAGVAYRPCDPDRALPEADLVALELATQAVWEYASWLGREVEEGRDPQVPAEYGWRHLRALRTRLTNARPQEVTGHRSAREAILATSGVVPMIDQAIAALKEAA